MSTSQDEIPLPSKQPLAVDYLQNRQEEYPNTQIAFDVTKKQFVPNPQGLNQRIVPVGLREFQRENELQLFSTTESFTKAVAELKKKKRDETQIAKFNLEGAHDWKDVYDIVASAQTKYMKKDSTSGKIRAMFRKMGDNSKSIQSFVGLLPDGNYKTLCGGLTLILSAMLSHSSIREKMVELMAELPNDIGECEKYSRFYPEHNELRWRVEQLYMDLLAALEDVVRWYMQGTTKHVVDSLLKNVDYGQSIENRIRNIKTSRAHFKDAATKFLHWRMTEMYGTVLKTNQTVQESQEGIKQLQEAVEDAKTGAQETRQVLGRRISEAKSYMSNLVLEILGDQTKNAEWQAEVENLKEERKKLLDMTLDKDRQIDELKKRVNESSYSPSSLARILNLNRDDECHLEDIDDVQNTGLSETAEFQIRAKSLAENSEFRDWLGSENSQIIGVQGNGPHESISSVSFLTALLQTKLLESENVFVLSFYCGLHTSRSDETSGPMIMVRALLAQILLLKDIDWDHDIDGLPYLALRPDEISQLAKGVFSSFLKLVSILLSKLLHHYKAIFLILDGIDWYDQNWGRDTRHLLKSLSKLASSEHAGVLKIFYGAASHSKYLRESDYITVTVEMLEEVDGENSGLEDIL